MNNQNLQEEKNDSQPAATPLAAPADSHQPGDEEIEVIQEEDDEASQNDADGNPVGEGDEKKDPQLAATPLAAAGSHQPILMSMSIPYENNVFLVPATMHLATAPICASNEDIEEEKMSPQLTAMPLPAGSRRLDDYDYDANEIELDLPSEGSVLVVDSSCVPADAQDLSKLAFQELVNNDDIQRRFRTSNPGEGASLVEIDEPVEVPSFSSRTLFFTGQASFTQSDSSEERTVKVEID